MQSEELRREMPLPARGLSLPSSSGVQDVESLV